MGTIRYAKLPDPPPFVHSAAWYRCQRDPAYTLDQATWDGLTDAMGDIVWKT